MGHMYYYTCKWETVVGFIYIAKDENENFIMEKYTHITSSEQRTVCLRHVHVVVVILELQMRKRKTHNQPLVSR